MDEDEIDRLLNDIGLEDGFEDGAGWSPDLYSPDDKGTDHEQDW